MTSPLSHAFSPSLILYPILPSLPLPRTLILRSPPTYPKHSKPASTSPSHQHYHSLRLLDLALLCLHRVNCPAILLCKPVQSSIHSWTPWSPTPTGNLAASQFATRSHHSLPHHPGNHSLHYSFNRALSDYQPPRHDSPLSQSLEEVDRKGAIHNDQYRSWSGSSWESSQARDKNFMSQHSYYQGQASSHESNFHPSTSSAHPQYASNTTASPSGQRLPIPPPPAPSGRGFELPPLLRVPKSSSGNASPAIPRSVTLPSVLNPAPEDSSNQRRRKADELASPHSITPTLPPLLNTSSVGASSGLPHLIEPSDRAGRRLLTPKSPIRRAISLTQLNPPSGAVNVQQTPFPSSPHSRPYMAEPGMAGVPPLPTPPAANRHPTYNFPSMVPPPVESSRRMSPDTQRYSTSPSPGYSGYDPDENSPTGSGYLGVGDHTRGGISVPPSVVTSGSQLSIPLTSAGGQSTYQMMTLKTTEGDVRFPVDVQAASRVADEKRKRNAGASARFRERRKKKEMEAATTISKLEQQVKDMSEDAEFYKKERDVLAGVIRGMSGGDRQLSARPTSPRLRRKSGKSSSSSAHAAASQTYSKSAEAPPGSPELGRNVRRRTSSFPMAQAPTVIPQPFGQVPHQSYPPPPPQIPMTHQRMQSSSHASMIPTPPQIPAYSSSVGSGLPPPPVMQAPPITGPYNPFASRYDMSNPQRAPAQGR